MQHKLGVVHNQPEHLRRENISMDLRDVEMAHATQCGGFAQHGHSLRDQAVAVQHSNRDGASLAMGFENAVLHVAKCAL